MLFLKDFNLLLDMPCRFFKALQYQKNMKGIKGVSENRLSKFEQSVRMKIFLIVWGLYYLLIDLEII